MPRNQEVIRQWTVLREIEASHNGTTINQLAEITGVTTRTIRRDLVALEGAGFPLFDVIDDDGVKRWKLNRRPFGELNNSFTIAELSALYFSRTLVECLAIPPFGPDLQTAFSKLESALGPRQQEFFDRLPAVIQAKTAPMQQRDEKLVRAATAKLIEAILYQRRVDMHYHSRRSQKEKHYQIEPYRLVYAQGSLYLFAYVPDYREVRTFAVARIRQLSILDETFEIVEDLSEAAFPHSLGINHGTPERVELTFTADIAPYIQERTWHPSQIFSVAADGSLSMTMDVCIDGALRTWILRFGPRVRVTGPAELIRQITNDLAEARKQYPETS